MSALAHYHTLPGRSPLVRSVWVLFLRHRKDKLSSPQLFHVTSNCARILVSLTHAFFLFVILLSTHKHCKLELELVTDEWLAWKKGRNLIRCV